jgi:hypothetical protein
MPEYMGCFKHAPQFHCFILAITLWIVVVTRAGAKLDQEALQTLVRATLRFFTKIDTGVVTNLFSQDLNLIDTELPRSNFGYSVFCKQYF